MMGVTRAGRRKSRQVRGEREVVAGRSGFEVEKKIRKVPRGGGGPREEEKPGR